MSDLSVGLGWDGRVHFPQKVGEERGKGDAVILRVGFEITLKPLLVCFLHVFCTGPQMAGSYKRAQPCLGLEVWCE